MFLSVIVLYPETIDKVIFAGCALHNYLRTKWPARYFQSESIDMEIEDETVRPGNRQNEGAIIKKVN